MSQPHVSGVDELFSWAKRWRGPSVDRRKISAREAVSDIRSGMEDGALMKKYGLSPDGLQSLYDKLVDKGFIDLGEMQRHLSGFLGSVIIPEAELSPQKESSKGASMERKPARMINARESARDIRSGFTDAMLMKKYGLTPKGLNSLFEKLMSLGLLTQRDRDRRGHGEDDHTVDLREEKLSLSDAFRQLGLHATTPSVVEIDTEPVQSKIMPVTGESAEKPTAPVHRIVGAKIPQESPYVESSENPWYDRSSIVILFLIGFFPLGLYGLYRTRRLSVGSKALLIAGWMALTVAFIVWSFPEEAKAILHFWGMR
jgi:hypothetical protein